MKKIKKTKTYKCAKCGKVKDKSQGYFILGGSTFCCNICCKKGGKAKKESNICEFC